jgi:membrane-bound lytic murein transglycosylase A
MALTMAPLLLPDALGADALAAFRAGCRGAARREDRSGLTRPQDWQAVCAAAAAGDDLSAVLAAHMVAVRLGDGRGFATGYFEPEIRASRVRAPGYATPFYRRPPDLVEADLGAFRTEWKGRTLRGRLERGRVIPYHDRAAIAAGALAGRGLELAFAADADAAFFLEIQGSGRLRLPDGGVMRIGYDGQNGHDYVAIGRVLKDRGALADPVTMQSILDWLARHPDEAPAVRNANPSVVFFRELTELSADQGPKGALGQPLVAQHSAAVDPAFAPMGAPLLVTLPGGGTRLVVALDTGGAIKGPGRVDVFVGSGAEAGAEAGRLASPVDVRLLLPRPAAERLLAR